jgi:hypothetical protein
MATPEQTNRGEMAITLIERGKLASRWRGFTLCRMVLFLVLSTYFLPKCQSQEHEPIEVVLGIDYGSNSWKSGFGDAYLRGLNIDAWARFSLGERWSWCLSVGYDALKTKDSNDLVHGEEDIDLHSIPIAGEVLFDLGMQGAIPYLHAGFGFIPRFDIRAGGTSLGTGRAIYFPFGVGLRTPDGVLSIDVSMKFVHNVSNIVPSGSCYSLTVVKVGLGIYRATVE